MRLSPRCVFNDWMSADYEMKFSFSNDTLKITSQNTSQFAGHNVSFDGDYKPGQISYIDVFRNFFGEEATAFCGAVTVERCNFVNENLAVSFKFSEDDVMKGFTNVIGTTGFLPGAADPQITIAKDSSINADKPYYYEMENLEVYTNDSRQIVIDWMLTLAREKNEAITKDDFIFHVTQ